MTTITLKINVEQTVYEAPTEWRMLGARGKSEHVISLCKSHDIRPERILEVGAGDGAILRCLAEKNFCQQMHALEISQSGVDVILGQKIPGLVSCQTFDGYNLPFEDESFDLVILSHVLEHVEFERALLREILRVSKYQVIEIPMDCNALGNEAYYLLGPSYGHINARSPDSLRFLLTTEGFETLDELLGQYSLDLQEYDYFINNSRERTQRSTEQFQKGYKETEARLNTLSRVEKTKISSFYAVLTQKEDPSALYARALRGINSSISAGQVQAARLIFNHFIPNELVPEYALKIARSAEKNNPSIALEFASRALTLDSENAIVRDLVHNLQKRGTNDETALITGATQTNSTSPHKVVKRKLTASARSKFSAIARFLTNIRR